MYICLKRMFCLKLYVCFGEDFSYLFIFSNVLHDDVIKWIHFPRYWPFVRGIHRWPVNSPHKSQWRWLMFSLICAWISCWVNNSEAGDLGRHRAHYDVTIIYLIPLPSVSFCWLDGKPHWGNVSLFLPTLTVLKMPWQREDINYSLRGPRMARSHKHHHDCNLHRGIPKWWLYHNMWLIEINQWCVGFCSEQVRNNVISLLLSILQILDVLTHLPLVAHICVSELGQHWFR